MNHPYFGLNVKRVRRALGVSREELAVAVGVGLQTIKNYETRRTEPQLSILIRLMAKLGVEDLGDLLKPHSR